MAPAKTTRKIASWTVALGPLLMLLVGCSPYMRTPNWTNPGPVGPQRTDAIYHDPYPLNDIAPAIDGGRPLGYLNPVPETIRGRLVEPQQTIVTPVVPPPGF